MNAVRQAVWCQFSCQLSSKFSLCALQSELITIFEGDGPMHTVPLPFRASRLWPACDGIIVEKQSGADDGEEHLLFSLLHPLEELRPVFFAAAAEGPDHPIKQRVLFSSTQVAAPLLVTQHEASDTMVVWVTRQRVVSAESVGLVEDSVPVRPRPCPLAAAPPSDACLMRLRACDALAPILGSAQRSQVRLVSPPPCAKKERHGSPTLCSWAAPSCRPIRTPRWTRSWRSCWKRSGPRS